MKFLICFPLLLSVAVAAPSQTVNTYPYPTLLMDMVVIHHVIFDTIAALNENTKDDKLEVEDLDNTVYKYGDADEDRLVDALNKDKTGQDTGELPTRCPCKIDDVKPVCGSDIRTYRSPCMFECHKKLLGSKGTHLHIGHRGRCFRHSINPLLKIG